jgi:hypothetical protein
MVGAGFQDLARPSYNGIIKLGFRFFCNWGRRIKADFCSFQQYSMLRKFCYCPYFKHWKPAAFTCENRFYCLLSSLTASVMAESTLLPLQLKTVD